MKFTTARAVAPGAVREPEDLHDVPRNLHATALHLRGLLDGSRGDLRDALRAYYAGGWDRNVGAPDRDKYVARVATYYAFLKAKRTHRHLASAAERPAPAPSQNPWTGGAAR
jgi:soluble lytic murein transglycosylase-like protein